MRSAVLSALAMIAALPAVAQTPDDEAKVRAVVADWYQHVADPKAKPPYRLMAPGGVDAGPGYAEIPYIPPEKRSAAAYNGPTINNELVAKAMRFSYEIERMVLNPDLAKVDVWERGYFYASAAQKTYELAVNTTFVLEKRPDGTWKILLHEGHGEGIPPNKITNPMPDLREEYYAKCGPACDPVADAKKAREW